MAPAAAPLLMMALLAGAASALDNGVGLTPPMGFNPWNCFGISSHGSCKLPLPWLKGSKMPCHGFNESVIMAVARAIASSPLKSAGYEYVNLDCGYSTGFRGADGSLTVNKQKYPHGMVWLGQQISSLGLRFGMYSDAGAMQCCSRVYGEGVNDGSLGHEEQDARTFAAWGVGYLKHDGCGQSASSYPGMRDALNKTGVPIYYSIHGPTRVPDIANCWRTTGDIDNTWQSIIERAVANDRFADAARPGAFNDPDMLEAGNLWGALGDAEGRSQMAMWSVMKSPLLIGTDVTNMTAATLATLTATEVIGVNQDSLGVQAKLLLQNGSARGLSDSVRRPDERDGNASAWAWAVSSGSVPDSSWSMQVDGRLAHPAPAPAAIVVSDAEITSQPAAQLCLTVPDSVGVMRKQPLSLQPCTGDLATRQQFSFGNQSGSSLGGNEGGQNLVLKSSGMCVAMKMGTGPALVMFQCNSGANEEFQLGGGGGGGSTLCSHNLHGDQLKCLTVRSTDPLGPHHGPPPAPHGHGGGGASTDDKLLTWVGPLEHGAHVALLVNNVESSTTLHFHVANLTTTAPVGRQYSVRDLWKRENLKGVVGRGDVLTFPSVGGHDCVMLRFEPI